MLKIRANWICIWFTILNNTVRDRITIEETGFFIQSRMHSRQRNQFFTLTADYRAGFS